MKTLRAYIGDPHGCIEEFIQLYKMLCYFSLSSIRVLGDFVHRGPDSGAVVQFCRENNIDGNLGNHEQTMLVQWDAYKKRGHLPNSEDKRRTLLQMNDANIEWLKSLPYIHIDRDVNMVSVHGGIWPRIPMFSQPQNVIRTQMVYAPEYSAYTMSTPNIDEEKRKLTGKSIWWGDDCLEKFGKTEEQFRQEGWERWYRVYDHQENVVYGHSVWKQPYIYKREGYGTSYGIDTGSCFGGSLTAMIWDGQEATFLSVKAKKHYADKKKFTLMEE